MLINLVLPGRLKSELEEVKKYWLGQDNKMVISHKEWADQIKAEQNITAENVDAVMQQALVGSSSIPSTINFLART